MTAKEMWQWIHCNYGEELCLDSSDEDYVAPPSFIDEPIRDDYITPSRLNQVNFMCLRNGIIERFDRKVLQGLGSVQMK